MKVLTTTKVRLVTVKHDASSSTYATVVAAINYYYFTWASYTYLFKEFINKLP